MRIWCLTLLCVLLAGCAGRVSSGASDDQANWQGTWKLVSVTENGESQSGDLLWVVDSDHYNIVLEGQRHADAYGLTLDPSRGRVDVFHHDTRPGTYGGKLKGIYKVSSESLTVCYDLTGASYPDAFDASPGSRRALFQFQRER